MTPGKRFSAGHWWYWDVVAAGAPIPDIRVGNRCSSQHLFSEPILTPTRRPDLSVPWKSTLSGTRILAATRWPQSEAPLASGQCSAVAGCSARIVNLFRVERRPLTVNP